MERSSFIVLIDFDNVFISINKREPTVEDLSMKINKLINSLLEVIRNLKANVDEIWVRFYGGWNSITLAGDTPLYNTLYVASKSFPLMREKKTIKIDVVKYLYDFPEAVFLETFYTTSGLGTYRKKINSPCSDASCTFWRAIKRGGKRCPKQGCNLTASDLFFSVSQKTVDTSICIDAMNLSINFPNSWIAVFSADYDMVPGLVAATKFSKNIARLTCTAKPPRPISRSILKQMNINDITIFEEF